MISKKCSFATAVASARFKGEDPALQALEFVSKFGNLSTEEKAQVGRRDFPISTLDRLLNSKAVRERLGFQLADGNGFSNFGSSGPSLSNGTWHHLAVCLNRNGGAAGGKLFVDGAMVLSFDPAVRPGSISNASSLRLGQTFDGGSSALRGDLDDVALFARALDSLEVGAIYAADSAGFCSEPPGAALKTKLSPPRPMAMLVNNPLRSGEATIEFTLTRADRVEVRVYDVTGRLMRTLADRPFSPGEHAIRWDGIDDRGQRVPHGVYFTQTRFLDSGYRDTRKLVVLR